jgi:hypothetical protein
VDDKKLPGTTVTLEDLGKFIVEQVASDKKGTHVSLSHY